MANNLKLSTGMRNQMNDSGIGSAFDGGVLELRTGTQPASPNDAPVGTILASITLPTPAFSASAGGIKGLAGTWQDASADNSGTPTWWRMKTSTDGGGSSTTDKRIDGSAGLVGGEGFDLEVVAPLESGEQFRVIQANFTMPAAA